MAGGGTQKVDTSSGKPHSYVQFGLISTQDADMTFSPSYLDRRFANFQSASTGLATYLPCVCWLFLHRQKEKLHLLDALYNDHSYFL